MTGKVADRVRRQYNGSQKKRLSLLHSTFMKDLFCYYRDYLLLYCYGLHFYS